ncbi:MAG: TonB-dependent receptor plug domain-containing protein [Pseudomonadales bacterium]|jgi:outer membrane receptor protein involved in Fe transport|nr:TonB-dependent receptor plug domain-containing protein [Pseudomonadales bacterium]MDP6471093.1 TonB-dependent receptor plug domain-containing protein [Pseudomonadales bacterium]MDP6825721.1 TonB-dependent receptor plug domain-containing protein [Pseudomonadales bacterium]MDP6973177.1 TonB-dependent receptor plug domain-containing protein [Pseudomonadales bacterium]|tara:strand:+ start:2148 stop:4241 length:2094 start_codon:yes stop_codon:yes gene_type:complete
MNNRLYPTATIVSLSLVLFAHSVLAQADTIIEEIVVTGELRESALASTPSSVSVLQPGDRRQTAVQQIEQVLGWAPNVNYASGASRARFFQIRGIGERGQFVEPLNSSVGLLLDGVDMSGIGTAATMFDVAQVEVFRGPQGTLYGANALAGLINVVSNAPTTEFEASIQLDAGDYGARGLGAVVSGPLSEQVRFRLGAQLYQDDGFMDNIHLGRDDTNDHDELTVRGRLDWEAGGSALWSIFAGHVDIDNGYDAFSLDNNRKTRSDQPGSDVQETTYASVKLDWGFSRAVRFEGSLAWATSDIDYGYDEDWTFVGFHPWEYSSTDRYLRERDTTTLDVRWLSEPGRGIFGGDTEWVAGVFALRQDVDLSRRYTYAADYDSEFEMTRIAAYGQLTIPVFESARLIVGLRAERHSSEFDSRSATGETVSFDPDDDLYGGRLVLEWDTSAGHLVYGGVTRGYKAGGFNTDGTLEPTRQLFDPENTWNFEAGYKGSWVDDRLVGRAAVFVMLRDDMQIDTSHTVPIPGVPGAVEFVEYQDNAAEGLNYGAELELEYAPGDRTRLFASVGLLEAELEDYINGSGEDLDGRDQAHAPGYTFFAGIEFDITDRWFARLEVEGKDEFYFSNSHQTHSQRYELINAVVGYEADRWNARVWGRNLGDEDYFVRGFGFGNDPRDGYVFHGYTQLGEPRQFGVSISIDL